MNKWTLKIDLQIKQLRPIRGFLLCLLKNMYSSFVRYQLQFGHKKDQHFS